ncbi:MAG: DUF433 domain-containing protein [Bryobacteraceae bacterium]|nr:DUF433 domain-containing protein [Bryobacteraceae bacterium]
MAAPVDIGTMIVRTPGTCGGRPRIAGTRITVQNVAIWTNSGWTPEKIVEQYPHLRLAQIHAAVAFYRLNRAEIDARIAEEEAFAEQLESRAV